ncbi:MAG TPA: hypothetical protein VMK65_03610 [Longimicrobiales bacterium]|nr:hypothetical protein [Longimicrobiales bacterium]
MTARGRGYAVLCLALSLSYAWGPAPLQGQAGGGGGGLTLSAVQPLSYGLLTAGDPDAVTVDDVVRRGELELKGKGQMEIMMVLPASMLSPEGAEIDLDFRFGDAGLQLKRAAGVTLFDPTVSYSFFLDSKDSPARIFLGGLASPAADQAAGEYSAQITVIVAQP